MKAFIAICLVSICFIDVHSLNNGLARTPPMGWLSWARFFCQVDCIHHPLTCINENLYMTMADRMVSDGYLAAGYTQVNVDDCWMSKQRDSSGKLVPDPQRFSHGMDGLADYVHSKGLKMGIYEDYGTKTCGGYPGSLGHLDTDAKTFADWKVDMLKLDGCYADPSNMTQGYPDMERALNKSGRDIIFSCSWPDYVRASGKAPNYTAVAQACNLWRNFDDISVSWKSIASIIDYYDHNQDTLIPVHGPGQWNDPDMIVIGNPQITTGQARAQMTLWSIWSAPLFMSNDLRFIPPAHKDILLNKKVIAVDQDPIGVMGRLVANASNIGLYVKKMTPTKQSVNSPNGVEYSYAIGILNRDLSLKSKVSFVLENAGLTNANGYSVENLWTGQSLGTLKPKDSLESAVNPTDAALFKATAL